MDERNTRKPWGVEIKTYCALMHLSQFAGFLVPGAGLILPIVMWATNKDEYPEVNRHGKNILNWMLSFAIYFTLTFLLSFIIIGFIIFPVLILLDVIFVVLAAVKAGDGQYWRYPLSITFFKYDQTRQDLEVKQ